MKIEDLLKSLIGHKVELNYTPHEETTMRQTSGTLKEVNSEIITMELYSVYGEKEHWFLNRHACTLHSILDEGKK